MKKLFTAIISVLMITSALTACSTSNDAKGSSTPGNTASVSSAPSDKPVTLRIAWWGSQERHNRTLKVIDLFHQKYPNITVETEYAGFDDYWTKLATEAAGNNLPDVFQMDYSYLGDYSSRKLITPLDPFVSAGQINLKDVDAAYTSGGKLDNQLYALSLGMNAPAIAYDPAIFEKAGVPVPQPGYSLDDLMQTMRDLKAKVTDKDFYPLGSGLYDFPYYLRAKGELYFNKEGTALGYSNNQLLSDYLASWRTQEKEGLKAPLQVTSTLKGDQESLLVKGKAAMMGTTSNLIVSLSQYANRPLKLMAPPEIKGGKEANFLKPASLISISANSKNKAEAAKFIDFITNSPEANDILKGERGVPISQSIRDHLAPTLTEGDKEQYKYIEYVQKHSSQIDPPIPKGGRAVTDVYNRLSEQFSYDKISADDMAKQFFDEANKVLKQQ